MLVFLTAALMISLTATCSEATDEGTWGEFIDQCHEVPSSCFHDSNLPVNEQSLNTFCGKVSSSHQEDCRVRLRNSSCSEDEKTIASMKLSAAAMICQNYNKQTLEDNFDCEIVQRFEYNSFFECGEYQQIGKLELHKKRCCLIQFTKKSCPEVCQVIDIYVYYKYLEYAIERRLSSWSMSTGLCGRPEPINCTAV